MKINYQVLNAEDVEYFQEDFQTELSALNLKSLGNS